MTEEQQRVAYDRKRASHRSYRNLRAAARQRQGLAHEPFGTSNVETSSLSVVDGTRSDANVPYRAIGNWAECAMAA